MGRSRQALLMGLIPLALGLWACSKEKKKSLPAAMKLAPAAETVALPLFSTSASPGVVPCGKREACTVTQSARRLCCNAPGAPVTCKRARVCGQASRFAYNGMLSCNETADCKGMSPDMDVVCCITDDGHRPKKSDNPYNRATCTPRTACSGHDLVACINEKQCPKGRHCRALPLGKGMTIGACLP